MAHFFFWSRICRSRSASFRLVSSKVGCLAASSLITIGRKWVSGEVKASGSPLELPVPPLALDSCPCWRLAWAGVCAAVGAVARKAEVGGGAAEAV